MIPATVRTPTPGGSAMTSLLRRLIGRLCWRQPTRAVRVSDDGLMLVDGDRSLGHFAWDEVAEIVTFKRDLGIVDDIRLAFRVEHAWVEVSEDDDGWAELTNAVARHFPAVPPDWLQSVMFPPFEACERVIFARERPGKAAGPAHRGDTGGQQRSSPWQDGGPSGQGLDSSEVPG